MELVLCLFGVVAVGLCIYAIVRDIKMSSQVSSQVELIDSYERFIRYHKLRGLWERFHYHPDDADED